MEDAMDASWRWSNVPVPEPHVAGFVVGVVLHLIAPRKAVADRRFALSAGTGLVGVGLGVIGWSVRTVGDTDVDRPVAVVRSGPYARSRNPMCLGWTVLSAGVALIVNSLWLFVVLPLVVGVTHLVVRREERSLERTFGDEYRSYRRAVRRYL